MAFGPALPTFARLSQRVLDEQWTDLAFAARGIETAEQWWAALATEPAFVPLLTDRTARFAGKQRQESPPGFDVHVAALRDAGFREVGRSGRCSRIACCSLCVRHAASSQVDRAHHAWPRKDRPSRRSARSPRGVAPGPMRRSPVRLGANKSVSAGTSCASYSATVSRVLSGSAMCWSQTAAASPTQGSLAQIRLPLFARTRSRAGVTA